MGNELRVQVGETGGSYMILRAPKKANVESSRPLKALSRIGWAAFSSHSTGQRCSYLVYTCRDETILAIFADNPPQSLHVAFMQQVGEYPIGFAT